MKYQFRLEVLLLCCMILISTANVTDTTTKVINGIWTGYLTDNSLYLTNVRLMMISKKHNMVEASIRYKVSNNNPVTDGKVYKDHMKGYTRNRSGHTIVELEGKSYLYPESLQARIVKNRLYIKSFNTKIPHVPIMGDLHDFTGQLR